tara:strand:- start:32507 stop:33424 length:918 start_codon:yes stop_codon:yes gene_type:complete
MSEIEEEEEEEIISPSFALDDLTVEVSQYEEGEEINLDRKPDFDSISTSAENIEEEYELTAEDIPQFVQKFEVPTDIQEEEEIIEQRKIELIQPNAETPTFVQPLPPSEIIDTEESGSPTLEESQSDSGDFDGDGKIDEFEAAFYEDSEEPKPPQIPSAPSLAVPNITAVPVEEALPPEESEKTLQLPSAPNFPTNEANEDSVETSEANATFWPWQQQDEWPAAEIIKQLQAAIRSAKDENIAQSTVLLDEVGPHLGDRTSLVYSVGRLLMSIGRNSDARRMVESAIELHPDDPDLARAREKLIS